MSGSQASHAGFLPMYLLQATRQNSKRQIHTRAAACFLTTPDIVDTNLERELLALPNGRHDDQVDTVAYGAFVAGQQRGRLVWFA